MARAYDLLVVGGGPAGYVAAIRAAQLGMKTAVVESADLGGICLNWGCIPTKALLYAAEVHRLLHGIEEFGLAADNVHFDMGRLIARSREVAGKLSNGVAHLMRKNRVEVVAGRGRLAGPERLAVERPGASPTELSAPNILLATGARARTLPGMDAIRDRVWTYREAMVPEAMPRSVLIVGAGAIGIEFASFFRQMGAEVTVVEALERILPVEDEEISALAAKAFAGQGIRLRTGARLASVARTADGIAATVATPEGEERVLAERLVSAVGITGNVEDLGLEDAGVRVEKGHVVGDAWGGTGVAGLWAVGDVAGPPWLAHKASHEGVVAVERTAGLDPRPLDRATIPNCTYSAPAVASVGWSEATARRNGRDVRIGRFPFVANGKALALGEPDGLVKTVFDAATGELLGAHLIGSGVTELICGYVVAMTHETTAEALAHTVFPHPTLSETLHESALDALGRVLHT